MSGLNILQASECPIVLLYIVIDRISNQVKESCFLCVRALMCVPVLLMTCVFCVLCSV